MSTPAAQFDCVHVGFLVTRCRFGVLSYEEPEYLDLSDILSGVTVISEQPLTLTTKTNTKHSRLTAPPDTKKTPTPA